MKKLKTKTKTFEIEWAAPVPVTENITFLAKLKPEDLDIIHNTFKDPEETETLVKTLEDDENETVFDTYVGYTRYCGFSVEIDGDIIVTLKKNLGV